MRDLFLDRGRPDLLSSVNQNEISNRDDGHFLPAFTYYVLSKKFVRRWRLFLE